MYIIESVANLDDDLAAGLAAGNGGQPLRRLLQRQHSGQHPGRDAVVDGVEPGGSHPYQDMAVGDLGHRQVGQLRLLASGRSVERAHGLLLLWAEPPPTAASPWPSSPTPAGTRSWPPHVEAVRSYVLDALTAPHRGAAKVRPKGAVG